MNYFKNKNFPRNVVNMADFSILVTIVLLLNPTLNVLFLSLQNP